MSLNRSVLLVEDSDADTEATVRALARIPAPPAVHRCADGDEALAFLRRISRLGDRSRPAVVLLDLNLPGTDGRDVLEQIKADETLKHIPVVILTTSSDNKDVSFCYRQGASGYIVKPVDVARFAAALQSFCSYWFEAVELPDYAPRV